MKSLMRTPLLVLLSILLFQCESKNEMDPLKGFDTYMSFKVDGVLKEYTQNGSTQFQKVAAGENFMHVLVGSKDAFENNNQLNFVVISKNPNLTDLTYPITAPLDSYSGEYYDESEILFVAGNDWDQLYKTNTAFSVITTKKTSTHSEGTFSGKFYNTGLKKYINITEGKFRALHFQLQ